MSPKKLTETDKKEILKLYRQPEETTSTLADRYSVSSSTISRFLKTTLQESEYEELIQQKRLNRTSKPSQSVIQQEIKFVKSAAPVNPIQLKEQSETSPAKPQTKTPPIPPPKLKEETVDALDSESDADFYEDDDEAEFIALEEMLGEDIADEDEDEDEDEDSDDWDNELEGDGYHVQSALSGISISPLSEATVPRICYLVVDRASELITKPLKDFGDLGQIPTTEIQQRTLPVFDNHRVAKRFSNRYQRVIKVPDGRMLQKTVSYLEAKGITRLLIDGKVYSSSSS